MQKIGDYLNFPGGGTQFKEGVTSYIQFIERVRVYWLNLKSTVLILS